MKLPNAAALLVAFWNAFVENSVYMEDAMEDYQMERLENYPYLVYLSPASVKVPVMRTDMIAL